MAIEDENSNQNNQNEINEFESSETTIEEFLDKIIIEHKEEKKVFIVKPDNTSGLEEGAPESISHIFNWGAFLFNWIWGIKYKKWILLLALVFLFIPYGFIGSFIISLWAGAKGNQWAWENIQYKNEEDFNHAQRAWVKAWFIVFTITIMLTGIIYFTIPKKQLQQISETPYNIFMTTEKDIPEDVYNNTTQEDKYYNILTSPNIIVYWTNDKSELSEKNTQYINEHFNNAKDKIKTKVDLITEEISNNNTTTESEAQTNSNEKLENIVCNNQSELCINNWLHKNCKVGYCIINPTLKKYYKVRGKENVIPKLITIINKWNK